MYYYHDDNIVLGHVTFDHLESGTSVLLICLMKSLCARSVTHYANVF